MIAVFSYCIGWRSGQRFSAEDINPSVYSLLGASGGFSPKVSFHLHFSVSQI